MWPTGDTETLIELKTGRVTCVFSRKVDLVHFVKICLSAFELELWTSLSIKVYFNERIPSRMTKDYNKFRSDFNQMDY